VQISKRGVTTEYTPTEEVCNIIIDILNDEALSNIIVDLVEHSKKTILPLMEDVHMGNVFDEADWLDDEDDEF
jgi:hypothetical protein